MASEAAFTIVHERPPVSTLPELLVPKPVHVPAVVPKPVPARDLFELMERLDAPVRQAIGVRGKGRGHTLAARLRDTQMYWGWGVALVGVCVGGYLVEARDPMPGIILGGVAAAMSLLGSYHINDWIDGKLRKTPAPGKLAAPFLDAFKSGGNATTQALVTARAKRWADALNDREVAGQDLRHQLRELGSVRVDVDATTKLRLGAIDAITQLLPRHEHDRVDGSAIRANLEQLDADDRAQVAAILLERLYDGEKLIGEETSAADSERLYTALMAARPNAVNRDELQKLVANTTVS